MSSKRPSPKQRRLIAQRAKFRCEYCFIPVSLSPQPFNVDHIIPISKWPSSKGGLTELDNLAFSCGCNGYKGDDTHAHDPRTGRLVPLFHPRRQSWSEHFAWSEDATRIIGLTPTGRATVAALRMNRDELVKLRSMLFAVGEHPPSD